MPTNTTTIIENWLENQKDYNQILLKRFEEEYIAAFRKVDIAWQSPDEMQSESWIMALMFTGL
jgi:hypothetical protein